MPLAGLPASRPPAGPRGCLLRSRPGLPGLAMLPLESPCPEVGGLAVRLLGGLVLLCMAANMASLFCRPPRRWPRRASHRRAPRGAPRQESPSACSCAPRPQKAPPTPTPRPRNSEHSSPSPPPPARPARLLVCAVQGAGAPRRAPLGQVIYDARRLHCQVTAAKRLPSSRRKKSPTRPR